MPDASYYYEILELNAGASLDQVKQAYRDLAQVWHPDRFANSPRLQQKAHEKMKELNEAYEFLKSYQAPASPRTPPPAGQRKQYQAAASAAGAQSYSTPPAQDEIWCMRGHSDLISSIGYSPSGRLIVSGSYDKTVRVWQTGTGLEKLWFLGHKSAVTSVAFSPDNRCVLSGGMDKSIFLRDCESKKEKQYFYAAAVVECVAISPDGRYLLTGTVGAGTQLWEINSGRELRRFGAGGFVSSVAFSPSGSRVATGTSDGEVSLIDRNDGAMVAAFRVMRDGKGQMIHTVKFTREGNSLLTVSPHQLQMWSAKTGAEMGRLETGQTAVTSADLSPDGSRVATGHADCTVRLWSLSLGRERHVYRGHTEAVKAVAYSPDGASITSGSFDRTLRIWAVKDSDL